MSALGAPLSAFGAAPGAVQPPRARAGKSRAAGETWPPPRGPITRPRRARDSRPPPRRRGKDKRILVFGDPPMSGLTRATAVGTTLVAALALVVGTYPAEGADKAKAKDAPAKTKAAAKPARGTLAADAKLTSTQLAAHIDKLIDQQLKSEKVDASPLADDAEFLRRAYLDITGKIPTAEKAAAFLDSKDADKRAKLIDELLESKDYGKHQADIWQALLL